MGRVENRERIFPKTAFRLLDAISNKIEITATSCYYWQIKLWRHLPRTELPGVAVTSVDVAVRDRQIQGF